MLTRKSSSHNQASFHYDCQQLTEKSWLLVDTADVSVHVPEEVDLMSSCVSCLCDPNHRPYRYTLALFVALTEALICFCWDFPAGIQSTMIKAMRLDNTYYNVFYSSSAWPDIVMSILGTLLIDRYIGIRKGLVIFTVIVLLGQMTISTGAYVNTFYVMLIGRVVTGCGMGVVISLTSALLVTWFSGREVTFIFAVHRCFHRVFASLALFTPQLLYENLDPYMVSSSLKHGTTQMLCTVLCLVAVLFAVISSLLDYRGARIIGRKPVKKNIRISDILSFSLSYWILVVSCSLFFAVILAFTANAPLFYISKFGMTKDGANLANSFSYLGIIFITPFLGILIDVIGYNLVWGVAGIFFAVASVTVTICLEGDMFIPYLAAFLCSMAFTFYGSAIWVAVGYLVSKHQLTTAYGVMMSLFAAGNTLVTLCFGPIIDHMGYLVLGVFCIALLFLILLLTVYLSVLEVANGRVLNVPGKSRKIK